jgi:hypothetical protein
MRLQHQEPAKDEAPPKINTAMFEVHNEVSAKTDSLGEGVEDPGVSKLPALQAVMPRPSTKGRNYLSENLRCFVRGSGLSRSVH